jgi:hypothetical protein
LVTTDLPSGVRTGTLLRSTLNEQFVVLGIVIRVFAQEHREDRVFTENISVVECVATYSHGWSSCGLFERYASKRDNILILRQFKQHGTHTFVTLDNVGQTIEGRVVQDVADHARVNDAPEFVVHERTCVHGYQRLSGGTNVVGRQVGTVCELNVDQGVNRNSRVSGKLDKGVEREGQAVVQLICEVLKQTRIVDCNVKGEVRTVDEISILTDCGQNLVAGFRERTSDSAFSRLVQVSGKQCVGVDFMCLGRQHLCWGALVVADENRLCLRIIEKTNCIAQLLTKLPIWSSWKTDKL